MSKGAVLALVLALGTGGAVAISSPPDTEREEPPAPTDHVENVKVRLVLLDVVVVDRNGRTVAGLTKDDFQIVVRGRASEIDTLDVDCPLGSLPDAKGVNNPGKRQVPPAGETARRIVLAFDYQHLGQMQRVDTLEHAMRLVRGGGSAGDEIMVVAMTGRLRVEQPFTTDAETTARTLKRMQYDISLWAGNFGHMHERGWVSSLDALLDVLGTLDGRKAIVLYSGMQDVPLDFEFARLAAASAVARCSFYPVDANGLVPPFGTRSGGAG